MLNRLSEKYNFNREINDVRISKEKVLLPVDDNNQPNWLFMERYGKNLVAKKYKQYYDFSVLKSTTHTNRPFLQHFFHPDVRATFFVILFTERGEALFCVKRLCAALRV